MPAPKKPNTAAATAAVRRRGQETMAAKLRKAGWLVVPPPSEPNSQAMEDAIEVRVSGGAEADSAFLAQLDQIADVQNVRGPFPNRTGPDVRYYATVRLRSYPQSQVVVERDWLLAESDDEVRSRFFAIKAEERQSTQQRGAAE